MREKRWRVTDNGRVVYMTNSSADADDFAKKYASAYQRKVMVECIAAKFSFSYPVLPEKVKKEMAG